MLSAFYPIRCGLCGLMTPTGICRECLDEFEPWPLRVEELAGGHIHKVIGLYRYRGRVAQAVQRLKYERVTSLADPMASLMATGLKQLAPENFNLICPVPIHWRRLCWRGFNQAELIARDLRNGADSSALLRTRATRPQVKLSPEERTTNLIGAFRADASVTGKSILLVDDVLTSGSTAQACAEALKSAGASSVAVLAFARGS